MKGRLVALDRRGTRAVAALLVNGRLEDLLIDPPEAAGPRPGAVYRGRVERQMKGQGAAIVRLAEGWTGFLRGGAAETRPGQMVVVQVSGWAEEGKAVPVRTRLALRRRLAVLTPADPGINVSREIRDPEAAERLRGLARAAAEASGLPPEAGLVLRTAALAAGEDEIGQEIEDLAADLARMSEAGAVEAGLLLSAADAHARAAADWAFPAPDSRDAEPGAFARHGVWEAIAALADPATPLPPSGRMSVEATRALVAVDVDTGADTTPAAGLKANIAAARALPRALRLRGLGGQVVIDFAPMPRKDRRAVETALAAAFRADPAETSLAGWTTLGLFELTRKRDRLPLSAALG